MNILHVTLGFYPAEGWGGPVKIVHANARELIRRGHKITIYCTNLYDKQRKIQPGTFEQVIDGIRVVYFDTLRFPWWPGTLGPIWLPGLNEHLQREIQSFDVIHLNGYRNLMNQQIVGLIRDEEVPVVMQPHGTMPVIVNSFFLKRLYDSLLGRREIDRTQAFVALQESERGQILSHGVPAELIEVIPNGLDPGEYDFDFPRGCFRERHGIPAGGKLILFLGRINRKKGTDMLVEAFAQLEDSSASLAIVGPDDGQLAEIQALIDHHDLSGRVVLTGLLSGSDVVEAYRDADLFVLPCRTDTFPTTIMEACLAGVPMVITEGCEIASTVKDRVADVVPFDSRAFARAMQRVLSDSDLYQKYQSNCPGMMQTVFSLQATVDRLEALYRRVSADYRS